MEKYYRWTVLSHDAPRKNGARQVVVQCECGTEKIKKLSEIRNGYSKSCGCLMEEVNRKACIKRNSKHNKSGTRLHNIWKLMRQRCNNKNASGYRNYGGKGVKVCSDWDKYLSFEGWALATGYTEEMTLERKNSNGDYEPSNCEWITKSQNIARRNVGLTGSGKTLRSRFTKKDVDDIKEMRKEGITLEVIAGAFGSSISHVNRILNDELVYLKE